MTLSRTLTIAEVSAHLSDVVSSMVPGEEVVVTQEGHPIAVLRRSPPHQWPSEPGIAQGRSFRRDDDFDAPLADFADYMQ